MGCFSFLCKVSGKPAYSTSFNGSPCHLFLLRDGKVIEHMYGNYDSYGRVFKNNLRDDVSHELHDSFEWEIGWDKVCDLMFYRGNDNGIAMILAEHYTGEVPTTKSEDDPNQGWGGEEDDDGEYFGDTSDGGFKRVENPFHRVYWK